MKEYQCSYCGKKLENIRELDKHKKAMHVQLKCDKCEYIAFGKTNLTYHIKENHENTEK